LRWSGFVPSLKLTFAGRGQFQGRHGGVELFADKQGKLTVTICSWLSCRVQLQCVKACLCVFFPFHCLEFFGVKV